MIWKCIQGNHAGCRCSFANEFTPVHFASWYLRGQEQFARTRKLSHGALVHNQPVDIVGSDVAESEGGSRVALHLTSKPLLFSALEVAARTLSTLRVPEPPKHRSRLGQSSSHRDRIKSSPACQSFVPYRPRMDRNKK